MAIMYCSMPSKGTSRQMAGVPVVHHLFLILTIAKVNAMTKRSLMKMGTAIPSKFFSHFILFTSYGPTAK